MSDYLSTPGETHRQRANRRLLSALLALWDEHEEQRFGQLVKNISREPGGFVDTWEWNHGRWLDEITAAYYRLSTSSPPTP